MNIINKILGNFILQNKNYRYTREIKVIPIPEAYNLIKSKSAFILDVRNHQEFENAHVDDAVNIPLENLMYMTNLLPKDKNQIILTYCFSGIRAQKAANFLEEIGYQKVYLWETGSLNSMLDKDIITLK